MKKLSRYQKTQLKIKNGEPLKSIDISGKTSKAFRASIFGNKDQNDYSLMTTSVFPLDIPKDIISSLSIDNLSKINYVLNGCGKGSLINAVLNIQVQGFSLFDNESMATEAAIDRSYGGAVSRTRAPAATSLIEDATIAGMVVISQQAFDSARRAVLYSRIKSKAISDGKAVPLESDIDWISTLSASVRNALSWLLNIKGKNADSVKSLFMDANVPFDFSDIIPNAEAYRSHIHGKLESWSSNYKSSVQALLTQATTEFTRLASIGQLPDIVSGNITLSDKSNQIIDTLLENLESIQALTARALGLRDSATPLTPNDAYSLIDLVEHFYISNISLLRESINADLLDFADRLSLEGASRKEIKDRLTFLKRELIPAPLKKLKKIGGASKDITESIVRQVEVLNSGANTLNEFMSALPKANDIKSIIHSECLQFVTGSKSNKGQPTDEQRFRRNLDDLGRVAFGNNLLATSVYPLILSAIGQDNYKFINTFLFGIPVSWANLSESEKQTYTAKYFKMTKEDSIKKGHSISEKEFNSKFRNPATIKTQKGKIAYLHSEQNIDPVSISASLLNFDSELNAIRHLEVLAQKFKDKIKANSFAGLHPNYTYNAYFTVATRIISWKCALISAIISRISGDNSVQLNSSLNYFSMRVMAGRALADVTNALKDLNPPSGAILMSLSIPSAIDEASKSFKLVPKIGASIKSPRLKAALDEVHPMEGDLGDWFKAYTSAISKNKILDKYAKATKGVEDCKADIAKGKADLSTLASHEAALREAESALDLAWKIPHDIKLELPSIMEAGSEAFRIKGVTSHKTPLAKILARGDKVSDGLITISVEVSPSVSLDIRESVTFSCEISDLKIKKIAYHLPINNSVEKLESAKEIQSADRLLAVDLNANGIGVALFDHVDLGGGKSSFKRVPLTEKVDSEGATEYFMAETGQPFKVFHEVPGLEYLKDKVSFERKFGQHQRKFGAFLDPVMEKFRKTVVADVLKVIESIMVDYNVKYLAFENEVSNLESGAAALRTVYKSVVNFYLNPENDARATTKKRYWQARTEKVKSFVVKGINGQDTKFMPGAGVRAAGTSQTCSECGVNPMSALHNKAAEFSLNSDKSRLSVSLEGNVVLELPWSNAHKIELDSLISGRYNDQAIRLFRNYFKTKFMRTELNSHDTRSKQSKYTCYNPNCSCYLKGRDADFNAAINIGNRMIDKVGRAKEASASFYQWLDSDVCNIPSHIKAAMIAAISPKSKKDKDGLPIWAKSISLISDEMQEYWKEALIHSGINQSSEGDGCVVKVEILKN